MTNNLLFRAWDSSSKRFTHFSLFEYSPFLQEKTIHRCTDLKDTTGQLIYENDVVAVEENDIYAKMMNLQKFTKGSVKFKNGAFWADCNGKMHLMEKYSIDNTCCLRVIGYTLDTPTTKK